MSKYNRTILAVDYDFDNREVIKLLLSRYGYTVEAIENAAEALVLVREKRFDLILAEFRLPDMDGAEFCRRFREFDNRTPFVFFSASVENKQKERGLAAGAQAYLFKPDDLDNVAETVGDLILRSSIYA
jgi:FOG: CheY-like receiver